MGDTGSTSANFHEANRSEYLAHYVFSSFGTSVPVPRPEDTGLDLYCTLTERVGQRIWPRAYYSVQVKSTFESWKFESPDSIRWLIDTRCRFCFALSSRKKDVSSFTTPPLVSTCGRCPS